MTGVEGSARLGPARRWRTSLVQWLNRRDRDLAALRRAGRTAIVMPAMFALGDKVIGNPVMATFAAFGSFAMLLLADFRGPMRVRLPEQAALAVVGAAFVCIGTVASGTAWLAALSMAIVGFGVLFAGVVSSVLTTATTSLLLAFILPVSLAGPVSSVPDRLAGWGIASGAAFIAIAVLWPTPRRDPLRGPVITACRALAARLRSDVAYLLGEEPRPSEAERDQATALARSSVEALRRTFFATPYRPTGLSTGARTIIRLVDELFWLDAIIANFAPRPAGVPVNRATCQVKSVAASALDLGAELLEAPVGDPDALQATLAELHRALAEVEQGATIELPVGRAPAPSSAPSTAGPTGRGTAAIGDAGNAATNGDEVSEFVTSLDPSFRSQELSFAVTQIAANINLAWAAERRTWLERLLGRQPEGLNSTLSAARQRAASHVERHSVWLHNSVRAAIGLGLAVLVADLTGVQHSFWVVLGTLSVLAVQRAEHRPERCAGAARHRGRLRRRRRRPCSHRHQHHRFVAAPAARDPARRLRAGSHLVRRRAGRVHGGAGDPVQHRPARRLASRVAPGRGRRYRRAP